MQIIEITNSQEKADICKKILHFLPAWFAIERSNLAYIEGVKSKPMFALKVDDEVVGFVSLRVHYSTSCELYVLGLHPEYHGQGYGRKLIEFAEERVKLLGIQFMSVKTLSENSPDESYAKTREILFKLGYQPVEEFKTLWDKSSPCLLMIKAL